MDRLKKAKEERVEKEQQFEALVNKARTSALSVEETAQITALESELQKLDKEISTLQSAEKRAGEIAKRRSEEEKRSVGAPQDNAAERRDISKFSQRVSVAKALQTINSRKELDGAEKEMFEEAVNEAKQAGVTISGNIAIPSKFIALAGRNQQGEKIRKSLLDVATEGTDAVYTEYGGYIPILRPDPVTAQLGITVRSGLQGNVQWTRQSGDVSYAFETESSDVNETTPTLDNISVSPKRFGGYVDVTNQFMMQTPLAVESWLRQQLEIRYALTVDTQVLAGDGTSNSCTGILNYSGVNVISLGSSGGDMTYGALLEFLRETKVAFARSGSAAWITSANGEFALARTPMQSSGVEGNFVYKPDIGTLIGRRFLTSQLIPDTFTETATDLTGIIYSPRWESAILALWGGMDILFDPYTQALGGKKRFVVNAFMDVEIEQALEFAICKDWAAGTTPSIT